MARNKAKKLPGTLIGRQKQKLRQQIRDKNIATYEKEKEERAKRGSTGTSYSSHLMRGSSSSSSYNPYSRLKEDLDIVVEHLYVEGYADTIESAEVMAECISNTWINEILRFK